MKISVKSQELFPELSIEDRNNLRMQERLIELLTSTSLDFEEAVKLADYLIANGVKIPVRCEECKMAGDADNSMMRGEVVTCKLYASRPIMRSDDYCSYGERITGNG